MIDPFNACDDAITQWAASRSLKVLRDAPGRLVRFMYVTGTGRECFQIFIDPVGDGDFSVNAASIETDDDDDLTQAWRASHQTLVATLDVAWKRIDEWMKRPRTSTW